MCKVCVAKQPASDEYITLITQNNIEIIPSSLNLTRELINLTNFNYLIENHICHSYKKELLAILIVTSYVGHDELRAAHRQAISQAKLSELGIQRVFLLAGIPSREHFITQSQLQNEQQRFGDLLQGNFIEAYRNLSYKHIMGLQWSATECQKARFIIKIDDDIIYDIFHVKRYLEALELENPKLTTSPELLAGYVLDSKPVIRNQANKWYVSEQEYAGNVYPSYLSGWLYITNPKTALRLVQQSQKSPIFWIDDTWVTGILREALNIPMQHLNDWFSANAEFLNCCVKDLKLNSLECDYFVGPNGGDAKLLIEFLHNVEKCYYDECTKRGKEQNLKNTCVAEYKHIMPDHGEAKIKPVKLGR
ncbi:beta-1,3-galactosyltransferase 5 isoform 2-T2 [Cochliomyia hominivorax]